MYICSPLFLHICLQGHTFKMHLCFAKSTKVKNMNKIIVFNYKWQLKLGHLRLKESLMKKPVWVAWVVQEAVLPSWKGLQLLFLNSLHRLNLTTCASFYGYMRYKPLHPDYVGKLLTAHLGDFPTQTIYTQPTHTSATALLISHFIAADSFARHPSSHTGTSACVIWIQRSHFLICWKICLFNIS